MSLLLPHERKAYAQSKQSASAAGMSNVTPKASTSSQNAASKAHGLAIESKYARYCHIRLAPLIRCLINGLFIISLTAMSQA